MSTTGTSFAFDGRGGSWKWYVEGRRSILDTEVQHCAHQIRDREGELAYLDFLTMVKEKLRRAALGQLQEPGDGRSNLVSEAGIREIKWELDGRHWRLYYCEPLQLHAARVMLGLHFAQKVIHPAQADITHEQNEHIREAARRWSLWHLDRWG